MEGDTEPVENTTKTTEERKDTLKNPISFPTPIPATSGQGKAEERRLREVPKSLYSMGCHRGGPPACLPAPSTPHPFSLSFAPSAPPLMEPRAPGTEQVKDAMDQTLQFVLFTLMSMDLP